VKGKNGGKKMIIKTNLRLIIFVLLAGSTILFPLITFAQTPISCGQTISDSIGAVSEKDEYTFTANAGDKVNVRMSRTSGSINPEIALLYDSDETEICKANAGAYGSSAEISSCTLPGD
jgi:hypothetical protein